MTTASNSNSNSSQPEEVKESQAPVDVSDYACHNPLVNSCLTDLYQITMTYAYWINKQTESLAVFDLFFRKCPFKGEYCIFAGLDDVLRFLNTFKFTKQQIDQLRQTFPAWNPDFFEYLSTVDTSGLRVLAQREGSVVFPRVPLMRIEGPLAICQLIETTLLNLVNYPSLITTNAARIRRAVGDEISLLEFGLRRAQGPDGAMSASRYAYMGGFNGTSNVQAALMFNFPVKGTHAHSFVSSYVSLESINREVVQIKPNPKPVHEIELTETNFYDKVLEYREELSKNQSKTNDGELAAFIAYAAAFPNGFLALVDTYSTLESGIVNFMAVALTLYLNFGYKPIGIRLDSGDLAYLSIETRNYFKKMSKQYSVPFEKLIIVASNDIHEEVLYSLKEQGHQIDSFGIGTHLVTCKRQPALGCVYKLVEIYGQPRIKVSQSVGKTTIPGRKLAYRLVRGSTQQAELDLLVLEEEVEGANSIIEQEQILCEHPADQGKRCSVQPSKVIPLLIEVFNGKVVYQSPTLTEIREYCREQVNWFRADYLRFTNPTPYKVSVSSKLKRTIDDLLKEETPITHFN